MTIYEYTKVFTQALFLPNVYNFKSVALCGNEMVDIIWIHIKYEVSHIVCTYATHFRKITWIIFFKVVLSVDVHRKYGRPRSCPHLIDHIFRARITLILLFARLFY